MSVGAKLSIWIRKMRFLGRYRRPFSPPHGLLALREGLPRAQVPANQTLTTVVIFNQCRALEFDDKMKVPGRGATFLWHGGL